MRGNEKHKKQILHIMVNTKKYPDTLFEVSWEVCNKVGGIHTVVATKAQTALSIYGDKYITIGPDLPHMEANQEFEEDFNLHKSWRQSLYKEGVRVRIGRWKIEGRPLAILVDFASLIPTKDDVLKRLWDDYQVDSLSGEWDYVEAVLFGWASGMVISSYIDTFCTPKDKIAAHFHEWMTASGGLYLRRNKPYVATLFTTHATVMGRCIAGNQLPLYSELDSFNADDLAHRFNVTAKHSIEKCAAFNHDAFLTVSQITANESKYLIGREPNAITPNGFESDFVWKGEEAATKRAEARQTMISVAEAMLDKKFEQEPIIVGTSGRYEFRNKGLDILMESLKRLATDNRLEREILVYISVPAANRGARVDLQAHLADREKPIDASQYRHTTHSLEWQATDPIVKAMEGSALLDKSSKVSVVFVPTYLNGADGIFNKSYYELLVGMDMTIYPSYYEPWGYTPLESVAFGVPTITTSLAGFGVWVENRREQTGVTVLHRDDNNDAEVIDEIVNSVLQFSTMSQSRIETLRTLAQKTSTTALWEHLFSAYQQAYSEALDAAAQRNARLIAEQGGTRNEQINFIRQQLFVEQPNWSRVMVEKTLPAPLHALEELSRNLWWCWNSDARDLFEKADCELWAACERNPIALLDSLSVERIDALAKDKEYLKELKSVYTKFCNYMQEKPDPKSTTVSYFSMEYGLHSSLKIYSGGLGILAGDYLKEASDKNVPMSAVGLLYRYGYFTQRLSAQGVQEATYEAQNFFKLPISPVRDADGNWQTVTVALPGRTLSARVWICKVGRTDLYLLDTDFEANLDEDRQITHHLYGGDWENRLKQEILLGIGGIRALHQMGINNSVYHCNEGHAAFIGVERIRQLAQQNSLSFSEAMEVVRGTSLFTTHTPVPAGHDAFPESMIRQYMAHYPDVLGITWEQYINLGRSNPNDANEKFSMSVLASNLSQEINGVSWLHGEVSKDILGHMWPGYFKNELHIGFVTNGVHFPTWVATKLHRLYSQYFSEGFSEHTYDIPAWQKVNAIPDKELWDVRMELKERLIKHIQKRFSNPQQMHLNSARQMLQTIGSLKSDVLTIGFARRFATYKRAHLLFTNLERLAAIVNNKERPVQFIFAGKAHPNDKPGQDLIKRIVEVSAMPQFIGKIIFLQNYDMELARRMVQGVDVWLNTPTRPLEASGTSGEKCVMNGVLQFSVLDGWWVEGYKEGAGWMLPMERTFSDQHYQNELDAEMIYNTIEEQIVPKYYQRDKSGMPTEWVASIKSCVADIASNFTTNRMLVDYEERFYNKLSARGESLMADNYALARQIASWKRNVSSSWDGVRVVDVQRVTLNKEAIHVGEEYQFEVTVDVANLKAEDVGVEIVLARQIVGGQSAEVIDTIGLERVKSDGSITTYAVKFKPTQTGTFDIAIRLFATHPALPHRMDFALVKWA